MRFCRQVGWLVLASAVHTVVGADATALVRGKVDEELARQDERMECKGFEMKGLEVNASEILIYPDSGNDRVEARHGHPVSPRWSVKELHFTLARLPDEKSGLELAKFHARAITLLRPREIRATTQPTATDVQIPVLLLGFERTVMHPEWQNVFNKEAETSEERQKALDAVAGGWGIRSLHALQLEELAFELAAPKEGAAPARLVLSVGLDRGKDGVWRGETRTGIQVDATKGIEWDKPVRMELKMEDGHVLVRSPDAEASNPTTTDKE